MLEILKANMDKLVNGETVHSNGYVYYIWGARMGARTITRVTEEQFNDMLFINSSANDVARIDFTGNVVAIG